MKYTRTMDEILHALSHLEEGEKLQVGEIKDRVTSKKRAVLNNLEILEENEIITREKEGRKKLVSINQEYQEVVGKLSSRYRDKKTIDDTKPQNIDVEAELNGKKSFKAAIYRTAGQELLQEKINIGEESLKIHQILEQIMRKVDDKIEFQVKGELKEIFDEKIQNYDISDGRKERLKNNKNSIINAFFEGVKSNPNKIESAQEVLLPFEELEPVYYLLQHNPSVLMDAGSDIDMESVREIRQDFKSQVLISQIGGVSDPLDVAATIPVILDGADVFSATEKDFLNDILDELKGLKEGEPVITASKSLENFNQLNLASRIGKNP